MVTFEIVYEGNNRCTATHEEGITLKTDAPRDIGGEGTAFSPTDLVATALGTCILTTMGMYANRHSIDLSGARVHVAKEMRPDPPRRIRRLLCKVMLPAAKIPVEMRETLERVGRTCPVHRDLHPDVEAPIEYIYV